MKKEAKGKNRMKKLMILLLVAGVVTGCSFGPPMRREQYDSICKVAADHSLLKRGMTQDEVRALMGEPQERLRPLLRPNTEIWTYSSHSPLLLHSPLVGGFMGRWGLVFEYKKLVSATAMSGGGFKTIDLLGD